MDSAAPSGPPTAWSGISLVKTAPGEISELILSEHAHILQLFSALDDVAHRSDPAAARSALSQIWDRLASLVELDASAEEEICFPLLFGRDRQTVRQWNAFMDARASDAS